MHKLIILIPSQVIGTAFHDGWPKFLHNAEAMPGLIREATVQVQSALYGESQIGIIHELFFDSQADLQEAMASTAGLEAGLILQKLTNGQMTLLVAEHNEDDIENLRGYRTDD